VRSFLPLLGAFLVGVVATAAVFGIALTVRDDEGNVTTSEATPAATTTATVATPGKGTPIVWAGGFCSNSTELLVFLVDVRDGIAGGNVSPTDAAKIMVFRTTQYADAIAGLGRPDSSDGDTSKAIAAAYVLSVRAGAATATAEAGMAASPLDRRKAAVQSQVNASLEEMRRTFKKLRAADKLLGASLNEASDCNTLLEEFGKHLS